MAPRVRPWLLYGGVGLLIGFIMGVVTVNVALYRRNQATIAESDVTARPPEVKRAASLSQSLAESLDTTVHVVETTGRPVRGPNTAPVTIVEFTDYECPVCQKHFSETLPLVLAQYGDRIKYVVMNYPIPRLHPDAIDAAEAAECAADQGRFWEYHDRLFIASELDRETIGSIAEQVHLDSKAFARCVDSRKTAERVRGHMAQATALGVRGTPSFFVNGRFYEGAYPFDSFKLIIDDAIERAGH